MADEPVMQATLEKFVAGEDTPYQIIQIAQDGSVVVHERDPDTGEYNEVDPEVLINGSD